LNARAKEWIPNNKPSNTYLGLYQTDTSRTARYIGRFDPQGALQLKGLKDGTYFLKAYIDENQDGACGPSESQDMLFEPVVLRQIQADTLAFFLSKPATKELPSVAAKDSAVVATPLSTLILQFDTLLPHLLAEIYIGEVLKKTVAVDKQTINIDSLQAGMYTLRIVSDLNDNLKWDAIDIERKVRAEPIYYYPEKIKIRPNWELSLPVNIPPGSLFKK
jgi:hypothetical protein